MKRTLEKEMAYNRADFLRVLPRALDSEAFTVSGETITFVDGPRCLTITHRDLADRTIGKIVIPRAYVRLEFEGFSDDEAEVALARFKRYFHRGGG